MRQLLLLLWLAGCLGAAETANRFIEPAPLFDLGKSHYLKLAYVVPADRKPARAWEEKIRVIMTFVADVYRRDLLAKGYHTRGLDFEFERGQPRVRLLRSTNTSSYFNGEPNFDAQRQWMRLVPELEAGIGSARSNLIIAFVETYAPGPAPHEWPGSFALGARYSASGGIGMFSSWILRDEFCATNISGQLQLLADATPIKGRTALGHGGSHSPRFEFIEDGLGAVAHEVGHALGLPHDMREENSYVMGNGFRNLRVNYLREFTAHPRVGFSPDDARLLAYTRFLGEGLNTEDSVPPRARITAPASVPRGASSIVLNVEASDDRELAGLLVFDRQQDSVEAGAPLAGTNALTALAVKITTTGTNQAVALRVIVNDRSGNQSSARATIPIESAP